MGRRPLEIGGAVCLAIAATVILTYPLAFGVTELGRLRLNDGRWSIWVVAWVAHALTTNPLQLYAANIFHPHPHALALSEPNIGAGILAVPGYLAFRDPLAAHNTAVLAAFILAVVSTYALARYVTTSKAGAAAAGIAFAFCPYVLSHTAHIQLMMTAGLPLSLLTLHRFVDRPSIGRAVTVGAAVAGQGLSCAYYGILAGLLAVAGILFFGVSRGLWRQKSYWFGAAAAALVSIAIVVPFFLPHLAAQRASGFARTLDDARIFSADWRSYLASASWAHRWMLPLLGRWKEPLNPGFLVAACAVAGVWAGSRSARNGHLRDVTIFYILVTALAFWISFGPGGGLYTALYHAIPVFSFVRAPSRFGIAVSLGLAMLMAIAIDALSGRGPRWRIGLGVVPILVAVELAVVPLRLDAMPPVPGVYRRLAELPRGAVAEFPFYGGRGAEFNAVYMVFSTFHWQPLLNGYSDNFPPDFTDLASTLQSFPSPEAFRALDERQTRYVIVHYSRFSPEHVAGVRERLEAFGSRLRPITREDNIELYELTQ